MFTGIIQQQATLESLQRREGGCRLRAHLSEAIDLVRGESVSVNGVCLTVVPEGDQAFTADLSPETLARTTFGKLAAGLPLNIERALRLSDRLGGHFVQGHVDATGELLATERNGDFAVYRWSFPTEFASLLVDKGSICVDGISLTIVEPDERSFAAALIPETLEKTNLSRMKIGAEVNLEFDLLAKLARRMLAPHIPA